MQTALEILADNPDAEAEEVVTTKGLMQVSDNRALLAFVDVVVENNPTPVEQYKAGKGQALDFLVGQCMKESRGKGNPQRFREILIEKLK